jgi:hypothetical protein
MPQLANCQQTSYQCADWRWTPAERYAVVPTARQSAANELMAVGNSLAIPTLAGIPVVHRYSVGDHAAIELSRTLVKLDIGVPEHWERATHDPEKFIAVAMSRWIEGHGGQAIRRRFGLEATIESSLDEYSERREGDPTGSRLYLTVESDRAAYLVLDPTLELLEIEQPRLAATFFEMFIRALNPWLRVYDYRDAEERVEMLREWIEGEGDADDYEIPNVEGCIPVCLKQKALGREQMKCLARQVKGREVRGLISGVLELARISEIAERPVLSDAAREQLFDSNPPLPGLLAVFKENDAAEGCFDDEMENCAEYLPEPSLIIPFDGRNAGSVRIAFRTFGVACQTLAAASRLIDLMPGNEQWTTNESEERSQ